MDFFFSRILWLISLIYGLVSGRSLAGAASGASLLTFSNTVVNTSQEDISEKSSRAIYDNSLLIDHYSSINDYVDFNTEDYCESTDAPRMKVLFSLLAEFDMLAERYDLDYFLVFGSLLGLVRENSLVLVYICYFPNEASHLSRLSDLIIAVFFLSFAIINLIFL